MGVKKNLLMKSKEAEVKKKKKTLWEVGNLVKPFK